MQKNTGADTTLINAKAISAFLSKVILATCFSGCAFLHHVQIGDIDNRSGKDLKPFDIKVSETGVNIEDAGRIAKAVSSTKDGGVIDDLTAIISLFQQGPVTGNGVFNDEYAEGLILEIHKQCKSGRVTGLLAIREMRKYPVISGEIVKLTGYCRQR